MRFFVKVCLLMLLTDMINWGLATLAHVFVAKFTAVNKTGQTVLSDDLDKRSLD